MRWTAVPSSSATLNAEVSVKKLEKQLIAQTFVSVADPECVIDQLCARCSAYCQPAGEDDGDRLLAFEGVLATLRPASDGLQMRVEGSDLVLFYGVRMLLQGQLGTVITTSTTAIEWQPIGGDRIQPTVRESTRRKATRLYRRNSG